MTIKLNTKDLGLRKTVEIHRGGNTLNYFAGLSKKANAVIREQIMMSEVDSDNIKAVLNVSDKLSDVTIGFEQAFEAMMTDELNLDEKTVAKVMDNVSLDNQIAYVSYVYGRVNGAPEEEATSGPKE